jgi:hypothetical protein
MPSLPFAAGAESAVVQPVAAFLDDAYPDAFDPALAIRHRSGQSLVVARLIKLEKDLS